MSFILTPAAPVAPEVPSFAPANDARFQPDRTSTFGPRLSEARERMASPDARRSDRAEGRPQRSDRPERPEQSDRSDRPDRVERPEPSDRAERAERPERTDRSDDRAEASDTGDADNEHADRAADDAEVASDDDATALADTAGPSTAAAAAEVAAAATLLPTARAAGDGDPSTDTTVEEVTAPDLLTDETEVDTTVIADGVTEVDIEAMTASDIAVAEAEVGEMGRQAALTSLEQVSDTNLSLAERIRPATTDDVAGPAASVDETAKPDLFVQTAAGETATDTSMQGPIDEMNTNRSAATSNATESNAAVEEAPDATAVDGPVVEVDVPDRPVAQTSIGAVTRADSPEAVVVLAREATAPVESVKSAAATTQATAPLPPTAEANLWEDVRSAFERIRSTGDGQELLMRLRPAELGELLVQIRTQGEHVSVRLVTSSAAAQQTLVDDRLRLAAELARAGFDEGSVDIGQADTGDANQRGDQRGDGSDADRPGNALGTMVGADRTGTTRDIFERREPIRTESGFRPGRTAQSTINLTL